MLEIGIITELEIGTNKGRRRGPFSQSNKHSNWRRDQKVSDYIERYDSAKHDGLMECRGGALHS